MNRRPNERYHAQERESFDSSSFRSRDYISPPDGHHRENGWGQHYDQRNSYDDRGIRRNTQQNGQYRQEPLSSRRENLERDPERYERMDLEEKSKLARTLFKTAPTQEELRTRGSCVVMCRFNPTHILDLCNIDAHQRNCKDRLRLEEFGCEFNYSRKCEYEDCKNELAGSIQAPRHWSPVVVEL
ncbi:hypothetical protein RB195_020377 [Necator americanus]|uniref:CHHC U11-48K-type domain-containing protein n=1 Tax=Necator americanus TaxID=51031 RepID=A0ABR1CIK0_NECAM